MPPDGGLHASYDELVRVALRSVASSGLERGAVVFTKDEAPG